MDKVSERLEDINETLKKIVRIMDKPKSKMDAALERAALFAGALTIVNVLYAIWEWIRR